MEEEEDEKGGGSPSFAATVGNGGVVPGHLPFWRRSDIPRGHASTRRRRRGLLGPGPPLPPPPPLVSVLIVGLSYGARTVITYDAKFPSIQRQSYPPIKTLAYPPADWLVARSVSQEGRKL